MSFPTVDYERRGHVAWVTMNRPEALNAMNDELRRDLKLAWEEVRADRDVWAVILTGAGGRGFCAGADLRSSRAGGPPVDDPYWLMQTTDSLESGLEVWKPIVAAVNGHAIGIGLTLAIACDFRIAAENATFSLSEVNWGILPGALVSKAVADMVLPRHALYYACLGEPFDGNEAARIGMVNYAVPPEKLESATIELAGKLMKKSAAVLRATKQAIRHVRTMDVAQAYDYLAEKGKAIKVADSEDSYNTGLRQFLDEKSYKPTFEPFRLGTMLTDQRAGSAAEK